MQHIHIFLSLMKQYYFQSLLLKEFFCNSVMVAFVPVHWSAFNPYYLRNSFATLKHSIRKDPIYPTFNPYYLRNSFATLRFIASIRSFGVSTFQSLLLKEFFCNSVYFVTDSSFNSYQSFNPYYLRNSFATFICGVVPAFF